MSQTLTDGQIPTQPPATGEQVALEINKGLRDLRSFLRGAGRPSYVVDGDIWTWQSNGAGSAEIRMNRGGTVDTRLIVINNTTGEVSIPGHLKTAEFTATAVRDLLKTVDGDGSGVDADTLDGSHKSAFAILSANNEFLGSIFKFVDSDVQLGQVRFGRNVSQYIDLHGGGQGNHISSVSQANAPKSLWVNVGVGSNYQTYRFRHDIAQIEIDGDAVWHEGNFDPDQYLRDDQSGELTGTLTVKSPSNDQIQVGRNVGAARDPYVSFFDGLDVRRGLIQALADRIRILREGGAEIALYGAGDARLNGFGLVTSGNLGGALANQQDGDRGSFAFAHLTGTNSVSNGGLVSGSSLRPSHSGDVPGTHVYSGTWRCMGRVTATHRTTLFLRIA